MTFNALIDDDCSGFGAIAGIGCSLPLFIAERDQVEITKAMLTQEVKCFPV
jgi:hypothetical protein